MTHNHAPRADEALIESIDEATRLQEMIVHHDAKDFLTYPNQTPPSGFEKLPVPPYNEANTKGAFKAGDRIYWMWKAANIPETIFTGTVVGPWANDLSEWWVRVDDAHRAALTKFRGTPVPNMVYRLFTNQAAKIPGAKSVAPASERSVGDRFKEFGVAEKKVAEVTSVVQQALKATVKLPGVYAKIKGEMAVAGPAQVDALNKAVDRLANAPALLAAVAQMVADMETVVVFNSSIHR